MIFVAGSSCHVVPMQARSLRSAAALRANPAHQVGSTGSFVSSAFSFGLFPHVCGCSCALVCAGTFSAGTGFAECVLCAEGTVAAHKASLVSNRTACMLTALLRNFVVQGSTKCFQCPEHATPKDEASCWCSKGQQSQRSRREIQFCRCVLQIAGYYSVEAPTEDSGIACVECPRGANWFDPHATFCQDSTCVLYSDSQGLSERTLPVAPGWWRADNTSLYAAAFSLSPRSSQLLPSPAAANSIRACARRTAPRIALWERYCASCSLVLVFTDRPGVLILSPARAAARANSALSAR